jgi:hypothetical protein
MPKVLIFILSSNQQVNQVAHLQALLSMNISMPQVPVMNFREALKFNPNSSLSARLDLNNGSNSQATVTLKVSSFHIYINFSYCSVSIKGWNIITGVSS